MSSSPTSSSSSSPEPSRFAAFADLRCPIDVVLGTGRITLRECLALEPRTVLRLEQGAGDDLWVIARGVALARGEVSINENRATLRVTDCLTTTGGSASS